MTHFQDGAAGQSARPREAQQDSARDHAHSTCRGDAFGATARVAALFVDAEGPYASLPGVEAWGGLDHADGNTTVIQDAREYDGDLPVVAHPPCKRWGRFYHGSTRKPFQFELGDDGGCFMAALAAVHRCGGVIEHPATSRAWDAFGLPVPIRGQGWSEPDQYGGRSCYVEQVHYGHPARKATWLYALGVEFPELIWTATRAEVPQWMIDRYGEKKARKIGVVAMMGGKDKVKNRNATPPAFRDVLIVMAESVEARKVAA